MIRLDYKPKSWEQKLSMYATYLVDEGCQSSTLKSYMSAIKKILWTHCGYKLQVDDLLLNTLAKACRLVNDKVRARLPIYFNLLEKILFEVGRIYPNQYYLNIMYKTIFSLAYYGLLRIGELTYSPHAIRAKDIKIATKRDKIKLTLYTSKMHGKESKPQEIKIAGIDSPSIANVVNYKQRFFCPFKITSEFLAMRGPYLNDEDQLFTFRDGSPVKPAHVRQLLKTILKRLNFNSSHFDCHSFRIGRCSELIKIAL